jgi:hypothetical protein
VDPTAQVVGSTQAVELGHGKWAVDLPIARDTASASGGGVLLGHGQRVCGFFFFGLENHFSWQQICSSFWRLKNIFLSNQLNLVACKNQFSQASSAYEVFVFTVL